MEERSAPVPVPDPERLDLRAIVESLRAGKGDGAFLRGFLPATYEAPARLRRALYAHASRRPGGLKSRPDEGYDVYHDCVVVHLGKRRRAFVSVGAAGDEELSYENLHLRAGALAATWKGAGVSPGQAIAVVLPLSVEYVVALLAALRLGAVVSALPPLGATFVRDRLDRLAPDHVVIAERHRHLAGQREASLLPTAASSRWDGAQPSHWYAPDEPAARLLPVFGDPSAEPVELTAAALHEALLRDGLLVLGLDATDTLAAPGFDPVQFQPHLVLATLAAGAAYAEVAPEDVAADPRVLERAGVTVLGVARGLRDVALRRGAAAVPRSTRAWFHSLTEVVEPDLWDAFARALWARKVPGFCVAGAAAAAGVHLFTPPSPPSIVPRVWPAPGRAWLLAELAAGTLPALNAAGMYTPLRDEEPDLAGLPRLVLVREHDGFVFAGAIDVGRDTQSYPTAEVARVVERHPAVRHAAVVVSPGKSTNDAKITAIAFVEDERGSDGRIRLPVGARVIAALIEREMGKPFAPDRIEIFPLRPRLAGGVVDEAWCRAQYLSGALHEKARSELFVLLSRLGYILAGAKAAE
ncbi:AMP-binding protein [Sorangium sp. So ce1000]|uniref:AMP-binding protein n=1 Tax=Sorangium sp. So ce1000 TaxID=3133325 RepID=UPI003F647A2C